MIDLIRITNNNIELLNYLQKERGYKQIDNIGNWIVYVALIDNIPVGIAGLFPYQRLPYEDYPSGLIAELGGIYVNPEHRNKGIMTRLVHTLINTSKNEIPTLDAIVADTTKMSHESLKKHFNFKESDEGRVWIHHY